VSPDYSTYFVSEIPKYDSLRSQQRTLKFWLENLVDNSLSFVVPTKETDLYSIIKANDFGLFSK
jgi:hypothetical protein